MVGEGAGQKNGPVWTEDLLPLFPNHLGWIELTLRLLGELQGIGYQFQTLHSGLDGFFAHPHLLYSALCILVRVLMELMGFLGLHLPLGEEGKEDGQRGWSVCSP